VVKREASLHTALRQTDSEEESKSYEVHAAHKYVFVVIRDAFKEARRQLQDYTRRVRGQTKIHMPQASGRQRSEWGIQSSENRRESDV
jgi:hypothetical protein